MTALLLHSTPRHDSGSLAGFLVSHVSTYTVESSVSPSGAASRDIGNETEMFDENQIGADRVTQ